MMLIRDFILLYFHILNVYNKIYNNVENIKLLEMQNNLDSNQFFS